MKPFVLISLTVIALTLAACGGATAPAAPVSVPIAASSEVTPTPLSATYLKTDYADATSLRNQLALGLLKLEGTANAVTAEQAKALLPLWQAIVALSGTSTTAEAELTAVQNQIVEALQPAQLQAIGARHTARRRSHAACANTAARTRGVRGFPSRAARSRNPAAGNRE